MVARTTICLALAAAALLSACGGPEKGASAPGPPIALELPALDGGVVDLTAYRDQVVVLHLFTTWSPAAHLDAEKLTALHAEDDERVEVIGVALEAEGRRVVAPWRRAVGADYLVALATEAVRQGNSPLGEIQQVPTTVVLDRRGRVAARIERGLRPGELERIVARVFPGDRGR